MKQGDKFPVTIAGQTIAEATVKDVGDGQVTLVVPGTIVVMATATSIAPEAVVPENTTPVEPASKETIITGVDRVSGDTVDETPIPEPPVVTDPGENATVVETPSVQSVEEPVNPVVGDNANNSENPQGNPDTQN